MSPGAVPPELNATVTALFRTQLGADAILAHLGVAHNIFEHHDGVVHDNSDGERES